MLAVGVQAFIPRITTCIRSTVAGGCFRILATTRASRCALKAAKGDVVAADVHSVGQGAGAPRELRWSAPAPLTLHRLSRGRRRVSHSGPWAKRLYEVVL